MRRLACIALLFLYSGCIETNFDLPSIVRGPRVLSIVADAPEVAPGVDVRVHAFLADTEARDVELRWSMCLGGGNVQAGGFGGAGAFGASASEQFGQDIADPGCDPRSAFTTELRVEDGEAIVPGECDDPAQPWRCTRGILDIFSTIGTETGVPAELVQRIVETVGIAITVNVDVYIDGAFDLRAFKRISVTLRPSVTSNPPHPRFAVGDVWMSARGGGDPHECVPELGARPVVAGLAEVHLRPEPADVDWMETFPVVGIDGNVIDGHENAYYSWFATAGEFDPEISVAPVRNTVWLSPEEVGVYPLWVVVRDGHLGQSACRIELEVVELVPPYTNIERL